MIRNIFDSHSHYDDVRFDEDRFELINEQLENSVCGIMHAATGIKSSLFGIEMAERIGRFYTSVGIHPEELDNLSDNWQKQLEELARNKNVRAIGEIGLDYHYEGYDRQRQLEVFEFQLILAERLGLPVIIHMRDATEDCMQLLRKHRPTGVMHCFSGSAETAKEVISLGMYISFTGVLTFKNSKKAWRALEAVPVERLLLETDCPYMAPEPMRGKRCQSSMIEYTAAKAAELKGMDTQALVDICTENTKSLFKIE